MLYSSHCEYASDFERKLEYRPGNYFLTHCRTVGNKNNSCVALCITAVSAVKVFFNHKYDLSYVRLSFWAYVLLFI